MKNISSESEITDIISQDEWMMQVLRAAEQLDLPDWWIGAGFLRNKIWDHLSDQPSTTTRDVDLVYFDPKSTDQEVDWSYDERLNAEYPIAEWEVRNQARMHYKNGFEPFASTSDGIAHWTETATAVAVRLSGGKLEYLFCYGTDDLFNLVARPTPYMSNKELLDLFHNRIEFKKWRERWPEITVLSEPLDTQSI